MTTTPTTGAEMPEALRLAEELDGYTPMDPGVWPCREAAAELRRLHALSAAAPAANLGALPGGHPALAPDMLVNGGALTLAVNVLRRAGKDEVADELLATAVRADQGAAAPAATAEALTPRYNEWAHLRETGKWTSGVPAWAKDHNGQMSDAIAKNAVIDELAAALAPQAQQPGAADMRDAYDGAREDLSIWKRCALEAERDLRTERETTARLVAEINAANGPMHMGKPVQQPDPAMESVLVDGVAYPTPSPVAAELLRLHMELQAAAARAGAQAVPNQAESAMAPSAAYERHLAEGKRKLRPDEPVPPSGPQTPWCKSCGGCYEWGGNGLIHHAGCSRNPGKSACWYEPAPPAAVSAPSVPDEVVKNAARYLWLLDTLDDRHYGKPTLAAAWDDDIGFWTAGSFFGLKDKASIDAAIDRDMEAAAPQVGKATTGAAPVVVAPAPVVADAVSAPSVMAEAAKWLHAAYDRPPQTPECMAMLARVDAALSAAPMSVQPSDFEQAVHVLGTSLAREHAVYLTRDSVRKLLSSVLAAAPQAPVHCARCSGSGEDPEGFYDQSRGPDGDTHEGPCRACAGSGAQGAPAGWKLVPLEPDAEMIAAANRHAWPLPSTTAVRAAIAAAPPAPAVDQGMAIDPLQGAANWLVEAHPGLEISTLAGKLSIGFNRAERLHAAALAAKAQEGGAA